MTPVDATTTSAADSTASATRRAVSPAVARQAFLAGAGVGAAGVDHHGPGLAAARCSRETSTGAACGAVAGEDPRGRPGRSATRSARSRPSALIPLATAAARKPRGAVTLNA